MPRQMIPPRGTRKHRCDSAPPLTDSNAIILAEISRKRKPSSVPGERVRGDEYNYGETIISASGIEI